MGCVVTEDSGKDAVTAFWKAFDEAWHASPGLSAEKVSRRLLEELDYSLAPATIRDWVKHRNLPRREEDVEALCALLVGRERTRALTAKLRAARQVNMAPKPAPDPGTADPEPAGPEPDFDPATGLEKRPPWPVRLWAAGAALVAIALVVGFIVISDEELSPESAPSSADATEGAPATSAGDASCPTPTVRAEARKDRASATFCPDLRKFLLSDDKPDAKSAILVIRVGGTTRPPWFHTKGYQTRTSDGGLARVPAKPVAVSLAATDIAEFRVCAGDWNVERTYPEDSCGDWTPFWPPR